VGFLTQSQLEAMNFKALGRQVKISDRAAIYNPELIEIGDYSRIDDFCVISGKVSIGRNVHIAVFCNLAGGSEGITLDNFSGLAYAVQVFSQSDDYSGSSLTNPTVPAAYKAEERASVYIGRHCIVGTNSVIFPGVVLGEGCSIGAMSLVTKSTDEWSVYFGIPAQKTKTRSRDLLQLEQEYLLSDKEKRFQ
jgi:galactoside O-acetyltransferase